VAGAKYFSLSWLILITSSIICHLLWWGGGAQNSLPSKGFVLPFFVSMILGGKVDGLALPSFTNSQWVDVKLHFSEEEFYGA